MGSTYTPENTVCMYIYTNFFVFSFRKNCKTQVTTTDSKIVANAVLANLETPHEDTLKKRPAGNLTQSIITKRS